MKTQTRRYAKRQLTWMRKLPGVAPIDVTGREPDDVAAELHAALRRARVGMMAAVRFEKWQALGNDYLIVEAAELPFELTAERVRRLCDPHFGPGGDGVLELSQAGAAGLRRPAADLQPRRLGGRAVGQRRPRGDPLPAPPRLDGRRHVLDRDRRRARSARRSRARRTCRVDMGRARLRSKDFPDGPADGCGELEAGGRRWRFQHVSIGNPQCAIRVESEEELEALDLGRIGPEIEHAPAFPNRTNTSFWTELAPDAIRARIFERGVGETLSSGHRRVGRRGRARAARRRLARHRPARRRRARGRRRRVAARRPHGLGGARVPRRAEPRADRRARVDGMTETQSAWAIGLATFAGERMLDAWFPDPKLDARGRAGRGGCGRNTRGPGRAGRRAGQRGARRRPARRPRGHDRHRRRRPLAAARRHRRRLPAPAPALAPADPPARRQPRRHLRRAAERRLDERRARSTPPQLDAVRLRFRAAGPAARRLRRRQVPAHGRLRRAGRRADRRRRPRAPRRPPGRGHDRDARGLRQLQRRHARLLDGRGPHQRRRGGRRRLRRRRQRLDHGHAVGRRHRGHLGRRALPAGRELRAWASRSATTARSRRASTSPRGPRSPRPTARSSRRAS